MAITNIIPPQKKLLIHEDPLKHNVCAYCRVSTDESDQRNSLISQQRFFENYFRAHANWNVINIFADEGLSGTSLEKRTQFHQMLMLARTGAIDLILTKEVSRFSRNVLDLLTTVEELRSIGVYIWFLSDDINTQATDYRERLTQIATNAEQESLRTSRRVKWGQMQQMERGVVFGRRRMFGYRIECNDTGQQKFIVLPHESQIIKNIYRWFCDGDSASVIARRLKEQYPAQKYYKNGWNAKTVLRILHNEKYTGDLLQGKTWTPDPLNHKKKYNCGQSNMYHILDHHMDTAIIERSLWEQAQAILHHREQSEVPHQRDSGRYWLSGKVICGHCGCRCFCIQKKLQTGFYRAWVCRNSRSTDDIKCRCTKRIQDKVLRLVICDLLMHLLMSTQDFTEKVTFLMQLPYDDHTAALCARLIDNISFTDHNHLQIQFHFSQRPIFLQFMVQGRGDTTKIFLHILENIEKNSQC